MKGSKTALLTYLFVITIFTKLLGVEIPGLGTFDLYAYPVLFLGALLFPLRTNAFTSYAIFFALIAVVNIILKLSLSYSLFPLFKQIVPAFIIYLAAIGFLSRTNVKSVFTSYINISTLLSAFGIAQVLLYYLGISISNHPRFIVNVGGIEVMRMSSLLPEPSHFAVVIAPAFIYCFLQYGTTSLRTTLLFVALMLTFSATSYVTIGLTFLIHIFQRFSIYSIVGVVALAAFSYGSYHLVDPFKMRIDETIKYLDIRDFTNSTNATTFSVVSNLNVAMYSLKQNILLGVGVGGHEEAYYEYFKTVDHSNYDKLYERRAGLNAISAHSLLIRVVSETGLLGLMLSVVFIIRYKHRKDKSEYYAISLACLSYLIGRCFKLGGYFDYGIYFFIVAYYQSYVQSKKA